MSVSRVKNDESKAAPIIKPFPKLMKAQSDGTIAVFTTTTRYTVLVPGTSNGEFVGRTSSGAIIGEWVDYNEVLCLKND